jgi:hypothetical protein
MDYIAELRKKKQQEYISAGKQSALYREQHAAEFSRQQQIVKSAKEKTLPAPKTATTPTVKTPSTKTTGKSSTTAKLPSLTPSIKTPSSTGASSSDSKKATSPMFRRTPESTAPKTTLKSTVAQNLSKGALQQSTQKVSQLKANQQVRTEQRYQRYDVDAAQKQINALKAQLKSEKSKLAPDRAVRSGHGKSYTVKSDRTHSLGGSTAKRKELERQIKSLEGEVSRAKQVQKAKSFASVWDDPNFEETAQKGAAKKGNVVVNSRAHKNPQGHRGRAGRDSHFTDAAYSNMTDAEVKTYNYLYETDEKRAKEYLSFIRETLNQRQGVKEGKLVRDNKSALGRTVGTAVYGVGAGLDQFGSGAMQFLSSERLPATATQYGSAYIRQDLADTGPKLPDWAGGASLGQAAYDTVTTAANMAPSILLTALAGPAGASAAAAETLGSATIGLSAAGNAYNQAMAEGHTKTEARLYSTLIGASEAYLQKTFGGITAFGGSLANMPGLKVAINNLDSSLKRLSANLAVKMLSEGGEEYAQDILDPVFRNWFYGEQNDVKLWTPEATYSFLLGAVTSLGLEGVGTVRSEIELNRQGAQIKGAHFEKDLIKSALSLDKETEAYQIAKDMRSGKVKDNTHNVGELFNQYVRAGGDLSIFDAPVSASEVNAETTAQTNTTLDAVTSALMEIDMGGSKMSLKTAREKADIIRRYMDGELLTPKEINKLNLTDQNTRGVFEEFTTVQLPEDFNRLPQGERVQKVMELQRHPLEDTGAEIAETPTAQPLSSAQETQAVSEGNFTPETELAAESAAEAQSRFDSAREEIIPYEDFANQLRELYPDVADEDIRPFYEQYAADLTGQQNGSQSEDTITVGGVDYPMNFSEFEQFMQQMSDQTGMPLPTEGSLREMFDAQLAEQRGVDSGTPVGHNNDNVQREAVPNNERSAEHGRVEGVVGDDRAGAQRGASEAEGRGESVYGRAREGAVGDDRGPGRRGALGPGESVSPEHSEAGRERGQEQRRVSERNIADSWDSAFFMMENDAGPLSFADPPQMADGEMSLGYTKNGKWVEVRSYPATPEGLDSFNADLAKSEGLFAQVGGETAAPKVDAFQQELLDRRKNAAAEAKRLHEKKPQTTEQTLRAKDGREIKFSTVEAKDVSDRVAKASQDAARVGYELKCTVGELTDFDGNRVDGLTTNDAILAQMDSSVTDGGSVADHEVWHAYTKTDLDLHFAALDAIDEAGKSKVFQTLYDRAKEKWAGVYADDDPYQRQFAIEDEVLAEARAKNPTLGEEMKELFDIVEDVATEWEQAWDAQPHEKIEHRDPNSFDLANRYAERDGEAVDLSLDDDSTVDYSFDQYRKTDGPPDAEAGGMTIEDFVKRYNEQFGEGAANELYKTVQQMERAKKRAERKVEAQRESTQAERSLHQQKLRDNATAWMIYHEKNLRTVRQEYRAKLDDARREKTAAVRDAIRETQTIERAVADVRVEAEREKGQQRLADQREKAAQKLDDTRLAERMNAKKQAAERLRVKENTYTDEKAQARDDTKLRRNAAKAALRDKRRVAEKRAAIETEQGPIDTIRKNPKERTALERAQEAASSLKTLGRSAYRAFVNQAEGIDRFAKRQKAGMLASTLVNIVGGASTTTETIYKSGLVNRAGDRIGDSMKDVFLCWDERNKHVDENKQALLQDYMLHKHNIDRMSFVSNAREALETFESEHPWVKDMDPNEFAKLAKSDPKKFREMQNMGRKEFAKLVAMTDAEVKKTGKAKPHEIAQEYAKLLNDYCEARDKPVFPDKNGNPITAVTSAEIVEKYEAENPWLKEKAEGIYAWWDKFMREWVVGDTLSAQDYEVMHEMYPHYVPTYRADKKALGAGSFVGMGGASVGSVVKKAKGGLSEIVNIEDSFANLADKAIRVARTNELYRNMIDTAMLDDTGTFSDMAVFDWEDMDSRHDAYMKPDGEVVLIHKNGFELTDAVSDAEKAGLQKTKDGYVLSARYDGDIRRAYISEDLFKSIQNTTSSSANDFERSVLKLGNALTGPMKTAITGINPSFAARNILRDFPTAIINSISGMAFPKYYAQAAVEIARNSDHWQQYQALGGTNATYYNDQQGFVKAMSKGDGIGSKAIGALGWVNEVTEAQTRFAEYLATIDRLGDTYENRLLGIKNSAEVTVDFGRKGRYGKVINAWVPYWNPAVQGIDRVVRSVIESPDGSAVWKQALKTVGRASMTSVLAEAVIYALLKGLDRYDDWEELSDRTKDAYYCIPLADEHKFLKIPKNREWGAILGTPVMRLLERANGREDPFENYVETSLEPNFLPGAILRFGRDRVESDVIGVSQALELAYNKDFAGRSIVPYAYEQGSVTEQYDADTSMFARKLGEMLDFSPMQIDYIVKDYFGDFGKLFVSATSEAAWNGDTTAQDYAESVWKMIEKQWTSDNRTSNQDMSDYYDTLDNLEKLVQDRKNRLGSEAAQDTVEYKTQKAMEKLYGKQITELNRSVRDMPEGEEKYRIKGHAAALAEEALTFYKQCMSGQIKNPTLTAEYSDLPTSLSNELIRLDGLGKDYSFKPGNYTPTKYNDPHKKNYEYILDDEQKDKYKETYREVYAELMEEAMNKEKYRSGTDIEKAEILEATRDDVTEETRDRFLDWLRDNYRSTKKDKK